MKVKVGDVVCSEFGRGPVVAITKEWLIHIDEGNDKRPEVILNLDHDPIWVPRDAFEIGGGQDGEAEAKLEDAE